MHSRMASGPSRGEVGAASVGFLLLAFAFTWPLGLFDGAMPFGGGDGVASYFPFMLRSYRPVTPELAGAWDPTLFTGLPESHSPMGRYYPPMVLLYTLLAPAAALSLGIVLHHAWAGLGAYLLARGSGLSRTAAWLAGIVFGFGGFLVFHRGHVPMQHCAAWLPWVLWSLERFRTSGAFVWVPVTGTLLALQALAGQVQLIVMGGLVWVTYLTYFGLAGPGAALSRRHFLLGGCAACLLGVVGSLPQVLPLLEVARWSGYGQQDPDFFHTGELKPRFLVGLFGPNVLGGRWGVAPAPGNWGLTEHGLFHGVLPFLLMLAGFGWCLGRWRRRTASGLPLMPFMVLLLVANLMLVVGRATPLHWLLGYVPIYNLFHVPARHSWIFGLALGWLAGLGLDRLRQGDDAARSLVRRVALVTAVLLAVAALMVITFRSWTERPGWTYPGYAVPLVSTLAALVVLWLLARRQSLRRVVLLLVPLLALGELWFGIGRHELAPTAPDVLTRSESFPPAVGALHRLQADGLPPRCLIETGMWQADGRGWKVPASYGSAWGLSALSVYSQSMPRSLAQLLHLDPHGEASFSWVLAEERGLSAVAGRFVVAGKPLRPLAPGLGYQTAGCDDLTWAPDGRWPGHPSPLGVGQRDSAFSTLVAVMPAIPGESYLIEGELAASPGEGRLRIVKTRMGEVEVVGEVAIHGPHFAGVVTLGPSKSGIHWLTLESHSPQPLVLKRFELWHLMPAFAETARLTDADEAVRQLHEETRQPYPVVAELKDGLRIHENTSARGLATLVREVRPAESDRDAARKVLAPGRPVRELAHVVAPGGRSANLVLDGPRHFETGTVEVRYDRPDDITVGTTTAGEGFLVLAVTRCAGWSATIDGVQVPLHAVDGPLMGVCVPAGEHKVRFRFRPVLVWIGTAAALAVLGGAWLVVAARAVLRTAATRWS